mgnify:CR=1 FL=1
MYDVGQILYLLINKSQKIAPVQIVEQIVRKSIEGENVSYVVKLPNSEGTKIDLSKIDCEIFTSSKDIRALMVENATSAIDTLVNESIAIANSKFETSSEIFNSSDDEDISKKAIDIMDTGSQLDSTVMIDLGNGIKGKVNMSKIEGLI